MVRSFRFGYQSTTDDPAQVLEEARRAEQAGFDVFQVGDHVGAEPSPLLTLAAVSGVTHMRLGTLVLNNDLRHPVTLAQELATLDHLSGGRLEVGIGAGHSFTEYQAMGLQFHTAAGAQETIGRSGGNPARAPRRDVGDDAGAVLHARRCHDPARPSAPCSTPRRRERVDGAVPRGRAMPTSWRRRWWAGPWPTASTTRCGGRRIGWIEPSNPCGTPPALDGPLWRSMRWCSRSS